MVNANKLATEFHEQLPAVEAPEYTDGYEGFYHLISINGDVEQSQSNYIIRDFNRNNFIARKEKVAAIANQMQEKYGAENIILEMNDQYYNMLEKIEPVKEIVDIAYEAMKTSISSRKSNQSVVVLMVPNYRIWVCQHQIFLPVGKTTTVNLNIFL